MLFENLFSVYKNTGDMNVAHEDRDFYNPEQKRTRKAAGTTPEERNSFAVNLLGRDPPPSCWNEDEASSASETLGGSGGFLVDTFREKYPEASGVFTYWSVRAGNRPVNRGMRLDYCLASRALVVGSGGGAEGNGEAGGGGEWGGRGVLHDAFVLDRDTVGVSDHCPVGVVLRLGDHVSETGSAGSAGSPPKYFFDVGVRDVS